MSQSEQIPGTLETFELTGGTWERLPQPSWVMLPSGAYINLTQAVIVGSLWTSDDGVQMTVNEADGFATRIDGDDALALDAYLRSVALALTVPEEAR